MHRCLCRPPPPLLAVVATHHTQGGCVMPGSHPTKKDPIPESVALGYFRDVVQVRRLASGLARTVYT